MFGAETNEPKSVSVKEGDSVSLNPNITQIQRINKIVWRFGVEGPVIAKCSKKDLCTETNEIFKDRLQLDNQTGSLTINNMKTNHSGLYEAQIDHIKDGRSYKKFNVTVFSKFVLLHKLSRIKLRFKVQLQNIIYTKLLSFSFTLSQSCCCSEYHHSCDWAAGDHMTDIQKTA